MNITQPPPHAGPTAIILVHFGDPAPTIRCLSSLAVHESLPFMVIVADNGPDTGLRQRMDTLGIQAYIIEARHNPGFGAACNLGAAEAIKMGAEALWFLNNDAVIEIPVLHRLWELALAHPEMALWGTHQNDHGNRLGPDHQPAWFSRNLPAQPILSDLKGARALGMSESLSGASIFLTRTSWEVLGPWPEWCFLYWEDAAWCRRARALGMGLAILDECVQHDRGTTTGRRSPLTVYYGTRNALLLHREAFPARRWERVRLAIYGLQKRLFRAKRHELKHAWRGVLDALTEPPRSGKNQEY